MRRLLISLLPCASALALCMATSPPVGAEVPGGTPTFTSDATIDNPWVPFRDYRIRIYEQTKGGSDKYVIDVFTGRTRTFSWNGSSVTCRELQEWEIEDGGILEISLNWFAQATNGTVYYFGETVDQYEDGEIVAVGVGEATVAARWEGQEVQWTLVVEPPMVLRFVEPPAHVDVGATVSLVVAIEGADAAVSWASSDGSVLTVDPSGVATGVGPGIAYVTASAGTASAMLELEVGSNP